MTTTATPTTETIEELEADFSGLGKQKVDTLEELGIYPNDATPKEYCITYRDKYGRDRERVICPVNAPLGVLEGYILKEMGKQADLVDLTQHRSHDQIIQLLDTHSETGADIDSYDYSPATRKEVPFNSMQDAYTRIQADPRKYLDYLGEPLLPARLPALTASTNAITFTPTAPAGAPIKRVFIQEIIIKLFQNKMIYNKEIGNYLYNRVSIERRKERLQARQERMATRNNGGATTGAGSTNTTNSGTNILSEINEELSVPQLYAACEQAQKRPNSGSTYSFDKKWFFVRYNGSQFPANPTTTPPNILGKFQVQFQKKDGTTGTAVGDTIGEIVAAISTLVEKKESQKDTPEIVDMENEFSQSKFIELCEQVSKSKNKRGEYKLGGKSYIVRENTPITTPPEYTAQYLGHVNRTEEHPGNAQDLSQYLKDHIHFHAHAEGHHVFSKKNFVDTCEQIASDLDAGHHVVDDKVTTEYELNGHKYSLWVQRRNVGRRITSKFTRNPLRDVQFYAEVPNGLSTKIITSGSAEGLFSQINKINEKSEHAHHKPAEHSDTSKETPTSTEAHKEGHGDAGHAAHEDGHDTVLDKTFKAVLPGWLAKLATKGKNIIPERLRNLTTYSTVGGLAGSGAITGGLYALASAGTIPMGTQAALGLFGPIGWTIGGGIAAYKAYKWWKGGDKKDKDAHGGAH